MSDDFIREKLIEIFTKFDLIVVQEIRDSNGDAFPYFIQQLNKACDRYDFSVGERQGQCYKIIKVKLNPQKVDRHQKSSMV